MFFGLIAALSLCEIQQSNTEATLQPESQKMDITLPHKGKVIRIVADQPVEDLYTEATRVEMRSPSGEVLRARPKHPVHSHIVPDIPLVKKKVPIQLNNPLVNKFYQTHPHIPHPGQAHNTRRRRMSGIKRERKLQLGSQPYSNGVNSVSPNSYFQSQSEQYSLSHNIELDIHNQKLGVAFNNLQNLESQLAGLLNEFSNPKSNYTIDANTRFLLANFVTHLNFIKAQQLKKDGSLAPKFYNYYMESEMGVMDMMTLTQWETFKAENRINGMIQMKTSPLSITPQMGYGAVMMGYRQKRNLRKSPRKGQENQAQANLLRNTESHSPFDGYSRTKLPQTLTRDQLAIFILKVDGIQSHYDILWRMLPDPSKIPAKLEDLVFQKALVIFHKVSQFATITYMTLENIWNDLNEMDVFFKAIPNTMLNTLAFYRLDDDYLNLKCKYGNNTAGALKMLNEITNQTVIIQKMFDDVLVLIFNCKMDVNTLLSRTQVYRDYRGSTDLYSNEFQEIMAQAVEDVKSFTDYKNTVLKHLDELKLSQMNMREQADALVKILEKHKKLASVGRVLVTVVMALVSLVTFG